MKMESILIGLIVFGIICAIAASRKPPADVKKAVSSSSNVISFTANVERTIALKAIIEFAQSGGYKVDSFDENQGTLVLSDSISLTASGFFYPIELVHGGNNETTVNIGIKSKVIGDLGPIVRRNHEKCANGIRAALFSKV
jgi:hypothetical protein